MTQVTLTVSGATVGTFDTTYQMSDTDGARVIAAYTKIYGPIEETDPVTGNTNSRLLTPAEVVDRIASGFLAGVLSNTKRQEQADAAAAAAAAVTDIVATPST